MKIRHSHSLVARLALAVALLAPCALRADVASAVSDRVALDTRSGRLTMRPADLPQPVADNALATSALVVSNLIGPIADVKMAVDLTHTRTGDLTLWLVSPQGTRVLLADRAGGTGANFTATVFDDAAATPVASAAAPFTGSFRPGEPLAALTGQDPNGTWTLEILDQATGHTGTLTGWALRFEIASAAAVLTVTYLQIPVAVRSSDPFQVEWTVYNLGGDDVESIPWQDEVRLSTDETWGNQDDISIGTHVHSGGLGPRQAYTVTMTVDPGAVSGGIPDGVYHVLVRTDAGGAVSEGNEQNRTRISARTIQIGIPELVLDVPQSGVLPNAQSSRYYYLLAPDDGLLRIVLDDANGIGSNELYVRRGAVPTRALYDFRHTTNLAADQEILVPGAASGVYYILVYGASVPDAPAAYSITASMPVAHVRSISPSRAANSGPVTLHIMGIGLGQVQTVELIPVDGPVLAAGFVEASDDGTSLWATTDLAGAPPGRYAVRLLPRHGGTPVVIEDAVEIAAMPAGKISANLILPSFYRAGREGSLFITYENSGGMDLASPILTLDSGAEDFMWRLADSETWVSGTKFRFLGLSPTGPATTLRPGQRETIEIRFIPPLRSTLITVTLSSMGSTPLDGSGIPIDWGDLGAEVKPAGISDPEWATVLAALQNQIGPTWGHYATALRRNAERWAAAGRRVYETAPLFRMELDKALGQGHLIIGGRVLDATTGAGLGGITVRAFNQNSQGLGESVTRDQGSFAVYGVSPGALNLMIPGFAITAGAAHVMPDASDLLDREILATAGATAVGVVRDHVTNAPVVGAIVIASRDGGETYSETTDATGKFHFSSLLPGSYRFTIQVAGYAQRSEGPVLLEAGGTVDLIGLRLTAGNSIRGLVSEDPGGIPVGGVQVYAVHGEGDSVTTTTDADGSYELNALQDGTWTIRAVHPDFQHPAGESVELTDNQEFDLDFSLVAGVTIRGTVRNASAEVVPGAIVSAMPGNGTGPFVVIADSSGQYELRHLPPGQYTLRSAAEGMGGSTVSTRWLEPGESLADFDLNLEIAGDLTGQVLAIGGLEPFAGATVSLFGNNGSLRSGTSDAEGGFRFEGIEPGVYRIAANSTGSLRVVRWLEVPAQGYDEELVLVLAAGYHLHGDVASADGLTKGTYAVIEARNPSGQTVGMTVADENGIFSLDLAAEGEISIIAYHPDLSFPPVLIDTQAGSTDPVQFTAGTAVVSGRVTDSSSGLPLADADIALILTNDLPSLSKWRRTTTGSDGTFSIVHLVDGDYLIFAEAAERARLTIPVNVSGGVAPWQEIQLGAGVVLSGVVRDSQIAAPIPGAIVIAQRPDGEIEHPGMFALSGDDGSYALRVPADVGYEILAFTRGFRSHSVELDLVQDRIHDFELGTTGHVARGGVMSDTAGVPIAGAMVFAAREGDVPVIDWTDEEGRFRLGPLASSDYVFGVIWAGGIVQLEHSVGADLTVDFTVDGPGAGGVVQPAQFAPAGFFQNMVNNWIIPDYHALGNVRRMMANLRTTHARLRSADYAYVPWPRLPLCEGSQLDQFEFLAAWQDQINTERSRLLDRSWTIDRYYIVPLEIALEYRLAPRQALRRLSAWLPMDVMAYFEALEATDPIAAISWLRDYLLGVSAENFAKHIEIPNRPKLKVNISPLLVILGQIEASATNLDAIAEFSRQADMALIEMNQLARDLATHNAGSGAYLRELQSYENSLTNCWDENPSDEPDSPEGSAEDEGSSREVAAWDPNEKVGPGGYGADGFIRPGSLLPYTIYFENDPDEATASAQEVLISDKLDPNLDWSTFELGRIVFGDHVIHVPPGLTYYTTTYDLRPHGVELLVEIEAELDPNTGNILWRFTSLDPVTRAFTTDPLAGFLPVNDETGRGEGQVHYTVRPKPGLAAGTIITNTAAIVFDLNDPILTDAVINTLDDGPPTVGLTVTQTGVGGTNIEVRWSGDDRGGAGVESYDLHVSVNGGAFEPWLVGTQLTQTVYPGYFGQQLEFRVTARDFLGQRSDEPALAATVIIPDDYLVWRTDRFGGAVGDPAQRNSLWGDDADPDGDGRSNLFEFLRASDPRVADAHLDPTTRIEGGALIYRYRLTKAENHLIDHWFEWSPDGIRWFTGGLVFRVVEEHADHWVMEAVLALNGQTGVQIRERAERDVVYSHWIYEEGASFAERSPNADPNGDGLSNALAYALGMPAIGPLPAADRARLPQAVVVEERGFDDELETRAGIRLIVPQRMQPDATLIIEASPDLRPGTWREVARRTGTGAWQASGGHQPQVRTQDAGPGMVAVTLTEELTPRRFYRLRALVVE